MKAGWEEVRLDQLCKIARGGSPRPIKSYITDDDDGINWIKIGDTQLGGRYIDTTEQKIKPEGIARSRFVEEGAFLLSNSMSFGRPYILRTNGCIHDGWLVLEPDYDRVDQEFLYYALSSRLVFDQFNSLAAGSTVRNLNIDLVSKVVASIPPLEEQKRIVAVLDAAFEGLTRARTHVETNLQNAQELFSSNVNSLFQEAKMECPSQPIGELAPTITKGSSPKWQGIDYVDEPGVLFVTSENVGTNRMVFAKTKFVDEVFNTKDKKSILARGDVLTNIVGASIGRTAVFERDDNANINQAVCLIRCNGDLLNNYYLCYLLNSPFFKEKLHEAEVDNARANLSLTFFRNFTIPLPDLTEQKAIVAKIDSLRIETEKLEAAYSTKLQDLDDLRQSLLARAFAGELT